MRQEKRGERNSSQEGARRKGQRQQRSGGGHKQDVVQDPCAEKSAELSAQSGETKAMKRTKSARDELSRPSRAKTPRVETAVQKGQCHANRDQQPRIEVPARPDAGRYGRGSAIRIVGLRVHGVLRVSARNVPRAGGDKHKTSSSRRLDRWKLQFGLLRA